METLGKREDAKAETRQAKIKEEWADFRRFFWTIFAVKVISSGILRSQGEQLSEGASTTLFWVQALAIGAMVVAVAWYAYKFSGMKKSLIKGFLGFLWFGIVGIFLAYYAVKYEMNRAVGRGGLSKSERYVVFVLAGITILLLGGLVSIGFLDSLF